MKRIDWLLQSALAAVIVLGFVGTIQLLSAQDLKSGKLLQQTDVAGAKDMTAMAVMREIPGGKESGKHTQAGNEIAYIVHGSVIFEAQGKPPVTLKEGDSFQTSAGEVHNVKNASATEPVKALVFYVAKKGAEVEELSTPAK